MITTQDCLPSVLRKSSKRHACMYNRDYTKGMTSQNLYISNGQVICYYALQSKHPPAPTLVVKLRS